MAVVGIAREKMGSPGPLTQRRDGFSITRTFIVRVNSHADGPITVDQAVGLPQIGNYYQSASESHPFLFCTRRSIRRSGDKSLAWTVECEYESPSPSERDRQQQDPNNPTFDLPVIRVGSSSELRDVVKTVGDNPKPIVNSAGDPFKPHPKKEVFFPTLMIQRNEPITTPLGRTQLAYIGKINEDEFWGLEPGQWRCVRIDGNIASRTIASGAQFPYVAVSYEFQSRDTWDLEMLDEGWNHIDSGNKLAFKTKSGTAYADFLDGSTGAKSSTPHYLTFEIYEKAPFAALQLPQSFLAAIP